MKVYIVHEYWWLDCTDGTNILGVFSKVESAMKVLNDWTVRRTEEVEEESGEAAITRSIASDVENCVYECQVMDSEETCEYKVWIEEWEVQ